jgi:hypothetical protein
MTWRQFALTVACLAAVVVAMLYGSIAYFRAV